MGTYRRARGIPSRTTIDYARYVDNKYREYPFIIVVDPMRIPTREIEYHATLFRVALFFPRCTFIRVFSPNIATI